MADDALPLLLFPQATTAEKSRRFGGDTPIRLPSAARQRERIGPRLEILHRAFEAKRVKLQQTAPGDNPELVIVLETVGGVDDFFKAASKIQGLDWLFDTDEDEIAPDDDFHIEDDREKQLSGRLFLVGSNQQALNQLLSLWQAYQANPTARFPPGLAPLRHVFKQLKDIRYWGVADRVGDDVRQYWQNQIAAQRLAIRFEIEVWYFGSEEKNEHSFREVQKLLEDKGGRSLQRVTLPEIRYHGILAELPADAIQEIVDGVIPDLLASDSIMYFRPRAQSLAPGNEEEAVLTPQNTPPNAAGPLPVIALLDGLPQQNHPLIADRISVDDPDGWEAGYESKDRVHGTAMASLIIYGELDQAAAPLGRKLYVRPVLRPNPNDVFNPRKTETTPDDRLLIDLVHRAVRRIFEGDGDSGPAAPTVRVINLSLGSESQVFSRGLSPWARLLDWLSFKYGVLFVVSAGNFSSEIKLGIPQNSLGGRPLAEQRRLSLAAMLSDPGDRRLLAPAESANSITVGATHSDASIPPAVAGRFDLFEPNGVSPVSRVGYGFRRAVKPDLLMPGGKVLYLEQPAGNNAETYLRLVRGFAAPGHRVAIPPLPGDMPNSTGYIRGTSNATALASRHAAHVFEVVESLRAIAPDKLPAECDGVLLKALLAHGASWGELRIPLLAARPNLANMTQKQEFLARWLGYGAVDTARAIGCIASRATLVGVGKLADEGAMIFSAPLPPSLAGKKVPRQLVVTLAWFSPINSAHRSYRRAKLWVAPPCEELRLGRDMTVFHRATQRGTLQHEILRGEQAAVFVDGDRLNFKVNCAKEAGDLTETIPFALCVSLEVPIEAGIPIYQEVRDRIALPVAIQTATH